MRKSLLALLAALALFLVSCRPATPEPSTPPDTPPTPTEPAPLTLDALDVEFAVDGRDADALLTLQKTFPAALTDALSKQNVTVGAVNLSFGASGEATLSALRLGTVMLAFLPAEDAFAYLGGTLVAVERGADDDLTRSVLLLALDEPQLAEALRAALGDLEATLADYAGAYEFDEPSIAALQTVYEENNDNL